MKHFKSIFSKIAIGIIFIISNTFIAHAQDGPSATDSIEISLLTCAPHNEVYSIYGHTAIRYTNKTKGTDWTFNYGIFDFKKPFFVLRFLFGFTDYQLGIIPFYYFEKEYGKDKRQVVEQTLNLTQDEKINLYNALCINYMPENRVYRYNFIYSNCTTKARDIIEKCINGKLTYTTPETKESLRSLLHKCSAGFPWIEFSNDLCLGASADVTTDNRTRQFLPYNLLDDFNGAYITDNNGNKRPLVKQQRIAVKGYEKAEENMTPVTPMMCGIMLFILSVAIVLIEIKRRKTFVIWDAILMSMLGIAGIILLALFCSLHPTTSTNLLILVVNPIHLIYIYTVVKRKKTHYWKIMAALCVAFFIGAIWQDYASGMIFVILSLLSRCIIHITTEKKLHNEI